MIFFLIAPLLVLLSEAVAAASHRRSTFRRRLAIMLGAYLGWVGLCAALCIRPDEFGFCIVPLLTITAPWYFLPGLAPAASVLPSIVAGACLVLISLGLVAWRIGYVKSSPSGNQRAAEDVTPS